MLNDVSGALDENGWLRNFRMVQFWSVRVQGRYVSVPIDSEISYILSPLVWVYILTYVVVQGPLSVEKFIQRSRSERDYRSPGGAYSLTGSSSFDFVLGAV